MSSASRFYGARLHSWLVSGILGCGLFAASLGAQELAGTGEIAGRVINQNSGLAVAGATLSVPGSAAEATSDLSGGFVLTGVPAGTRSVHVEKADLQPGEVTNIVVAAGQTTHIDIPVNSAGEGFVQMEAFTVSADIVQNSDLGLLVARQKSAAISDAIGSDRFSKLAVGNAAEALSKVTGASLMDGKYVLIRGLGDRYSNTLLNNTSVPTADPDKRAVQMDQFPSDLIESISTTKSFTPDQPGAFSGGSVNIKTKSFPDHFFFTTSAKIGYNPDVSGEDMLRVPGQGGDSLAMGANDRHAPDLPATLTDRTRAQLMARTGDLTLAQEVDAQVKSFDSRTYFPSTTKAAPDLGGSIAFGDRIEWADGEKLFGYSASLTYDKSYDFYTGGTKNRYYGTIDDALPKLLLTPDRSATTIPDGDLPAGTPPFGVTSSTRSVAWGAFTNFALRPALDHELRLDLFHNQSADDKVQRGVGEQAFDYARAIDEVYDILYTERSIDSAQLSGKSLFPGWHELEVNWRLSYAKSTQDQPDYRSLSIYYNLSGNFVNATGVQPNRFFRDLSEDSTEGAIDVSWPFAFRGGEARAKFGVNALTGARSYLEQRFQYYSVPQNRAQLESFPNPVGIVDQTANSVTFGNTITRLQEPNSYDAEQKINAAFAMLDLPVTAKLRAVVGVRFEQTKMSTTPVQIAGLNPENGEIDQTDALPALNLVYASSNKMNWRFAYGRTIARPTFKELTDIRYEDVFTLDTYVGNPSLELTVIDNFDLRWEWFPRRSETVAVSAFYKRMKDPIEVLFRPSVGSISPQNVDRGTVSGVEFEFRRGLGFLAEALDPFSLGANLTFIKSEVTIPDSEMASIRLQLPDAKNTRDLLGQSPYVLNLDLSYDREQSSTSATLSYNVVGERLALVQFGSMPDVYEQPSPTLNFVLSQRINARWKAKLAAKNLLNSDHEKLISFDDRDLVYERYATGRSFSCSLTYSFE